MKKLVLVRHAKSSWDDAHLSDHQRPLNPRGQHDAPMMARRFAERGIPVERLLSSTARRAQSTAQCFAKELGISTEQIQLEERIYAADLDDLLEVVCGLDDALNTVMLCGHNPGFTDLALRLTGEPLTHLPTCGMVILSFDIASWAQVETVKATETILDSPKI